MSIYLWILVWVLALGAVMPQKGPNRKYYIIAMAVIHGFVCGFRYMHLTGDLMKYNWEFIQLAQHPWFSDEVLHGGRNAGFYLLMKLVNHLTGEDFQFLLVLIAVIIEAAVAVVVYRYSPAPWMSYLVWNCFAFYVGGFSAIKQALAMAFVMLSVIGIMEKRPKFYLGMMFLAGMIHTPALVFLPAYWLADRKVDMKMLLFYLAAGAMIFALRGQIVAFISDFYYEEETFAESGGLGNRFFMILLITACGVALKGFRERNFEALFHVMIVSTVLQMLASFDNIFTRLTDYYFQMSVLYIPMLFAGDKGLLRRDRAVALFRFNKKSLQLFAAVVCMVLIWFYYTYYININYAVAVDDYTNFRFMWDVK